MVIPSGARDPQFAAERAPILRFARDDKIWLACDIRPVAAPP